jgi:hypothetical protein
MLAGGRTDRETRRQAGRQTDRQTETERQTDRQADMMKLIEAFRNSANAPKIDFKYKTLPFV